VQHEQVRGVRHSCEFRSRHRLSPLLLRPVASRSMNGMPSCVNPLLFDLLRNDFNSTCFVQTDCCDSISTMVSGGLHRPLCVVFVSIDSDT
jgi:hypothetical protein